MEFITISKVSKEYNVSTRTLRYYEELGLITSHRIDDYAYRIYDEAAISTLRQIIILRKLRIPLKQIAVILKNKDLKENITILQENINSLDDEIAATSILRDVLKAFVKRLNYHLKINSKFDLLSDKEILDLVETLNLSNNNLKEKRAMKQINDANKVLDKMKNVRIIHIPPMTVASSHYIGSNPEREASKIINDFVNKIKLHEIKPDLRVIGFNNPSPQKSGDIYGYESWVSIPKDIEVEEPLVKKQFKGGLYAVHCIRMGDFHEWEEFYNWIMNNKEYEIEEREPQGMCGALEEHLNAYTYFSSREKDEFMQLDLLIPIKKKEK